MQDLSTPMFVVKRNGTKERVQFDKITRRICSQIRKDERVQERTQIRRIQTKHTPL